MCVCVFFTRALKFDIERRGEMNREKCGMHKRKREIGFFFIIRYDFDITDLDYRYEARGFLLFFFFFF